MKSPIYWHPSLYTYVMMLLCGDSLEEKYLYLKGEISRFPVLDIGCGDCYLARHVPHEIYSGLDINESFVRHARRKGLNVNTIDLRKDPIPEADVVVLSNVLHQLYPLHEEVLQRIIRSARKKAIICEPTHHIASSRNLFVSWIARKMNDPGYGSPSRRLSEEELLVLFKKCGVTRIRIIGREAVAVFEK